MNCQAMSLGWHWNHPWHWTTETGALVPVAGGPNAWWAHEIREGLRRRDLRTLEARRPHLKGIRHGLANDIMPSLRDTRCSAIRNTNARIREHVRVDEKRRDGRNEKV